MKNYRVVYWWYGINIALIIILTKFLLHTILKNDSSKFFTSVLSILIGFIFYSFLTFFQVRKARENNFSTEKHKYLNLSSSLMSELLNSIKNIQIDLNNVKFDLKYMNNKELKNVNEHYFNVLNNIKIMSHKRESLINNIKFHGYSYSYEHLECILKEFDDIYSNTSDMINNIKFDKISHSNINEHNDNNLKKVDNIVNTLEQKEVYRLINSISDKYK